MASLVEIQQLNSNGSWENIRIFGITTSDDEIIVLGPTFRIIVDEEEVYRRNSIFYSEEPEKVVPEPILSISLKEGVVS